MEKYEVGIYTWEQAEAQFNIKNYMITSIVGGLVTGIIYFNIHKIKSK
jgi:hypothetical protein